MSNFFDEIFLIQREKVEMTEEEKEEFRKNLREQQYKLFAEAILGETVTKISADSLPKISIYTSKNMLKKLLIN
jgi:hypothetical protein